MSSSSPHHHSTEKFCSHGKADSSPQTSPIIIISKDEEGDPKKDCCYEHSPPSRTGNAISALSLQNDNCPKTRRHRQPEDPKAEAIGFEIKKCRGAYGDNECLGQYDKDTPVARVDEHSHRSCSTSTSTVPRNVDECSKNASCTSNVVSCDSEMNRNCGSLPSRSLQPTDSAGSHKVDVERGLFGVQHITLQVQGMTCTGCEKKLFRLLSSLPEVSQVKTSLLLAQAEFDLRPSTSIDADNVARTMQKMTGFDCQKMTHFGEELELIVEGNPKDYADHWPAEVSDLTIIDKNRILVSYHPKVIGARDLLSNPFFQHTALAPPSPPPLVASGRAHLWRSFRMTLFSAACSIPILLLAWAPLPRHEIIYGAISLALATVVQVFVVGPFYVSAAKTFIFSRIIEMDLLVVLSTTTAYVYSIVAYVYLIFGKPLATGDFFETGVLLVTLILVGRTLSTFARQKAVESITIESLQANTAIIIDHNDGEKEIDARLLQYHDVFKVLPEMAVVTDGLILTGESELDESMITGEATLVHKHRGDSVFAGSINYFGTLKVQVTRLPCENIIKSISAMVDEAKSSKPKVQELADRVASYFVPAILGITVVVFVTWVVVGKTIKIQSTASSCIAAMTYAISVLIVSCPCAIGLAVPMVVVIAGGVGARHGLIFKTAETIDIARNVTHVIFDKTGTLTQGKLHVVAEEYMKVPSSYEPSLILGLTKNSKHPIAASISSHLQESGIEPSIIDHIVSTPGKGIQATWKGCLVRAGNPYWLNVQNLAPVRKVLTSGNSLFCVTLDKKLIAVYGLHDCLRPDAILAISELRTRGIAVSLISGDTQESVLSLATELGIPSTHVLARCTPKQKQEYVRSQLTTNLGRRKAVVLFCGDGTNDAPSLAQASIGVHLNEGTEVAGSAADAVIMRPSLSGIITLMDLSKAFHQRVVFNFVWSFLYNLLAVLLAAGAFPRVRIPPQYAGLGEVVSVLPVIGVAMGLRWKKF